MLLTRFFIASHTIQFTQLYIKNPLKLHFSIYLYTYLN